LTISPSPLVSLRGALARIPLLLLLIAVLVASGCGREEDPDLVNGKRLYVGEGQCGSCHELARAGTKGKTGPNLDQAFAQARRDGLGQQTVEDVVRQQIANPRRNSTMPKDLVTGDDARDVAAYVALVAAAGGEDTGALATAGQPKAGGTARQEGATLEIPADPSGALAFAFSKAVGEAGKITFVMPNESPVQHDIGVKDGGEIGKGAVVGQGGTSRFTATLKPGTYTFFCSVAGHEAGGMKGTLTVE
jgi:plastocyanin